MSETNNLTPEQCAAIAKEAIVWAKWSVNNAFTPNEAAQRILALAQPDEKPLLKWPGMRNEVEVDDNTAVRRWRVYQDDSDPHKYPGFGQYHAVYATTRAEAIAQWNKCVRALRGRVDAEVRSILVAARENAEHHWHLGCIDCGRTMRRINEWLAEQENPQQE